ncbi:hypothetical protein CTAYLR_006441 [Chrysophaeum taylorii]|uniref:RRM domain-containing protein n=1 Tax=Chrysophaeum taylorii TaxID=2483200 RepID=A0AAD7UMY9_9STRA|nr:hypothetical protein CTAYLR_006441 [Chrysophaeum taylorii]
MKPEKVRHLLSQFGEVTRVYLEEEDGAVAKRRRKEGKSRKKMYVEGWIEFGDKKVAKNVAASLNNTPIGKVKTKEFYAQDLWNLKYLKGFKWDHLTEKIAYERRVRGLQLREQMANAHRMSADYLKNVDQRKAIAAMESRKHARGQLDAQSEPTLPTKKRKERTFVQRKTATAAAKPATSDDALLRAL